MQQRTKPKIEGRILKLGGFVMLGLVVITITPGDSVAKSRLFGAVLAAAAIALMLFVVALVTILRQGPFTSVLVMAQPQGNNFLTRLTTTRLAEGRR